MAELKTYRGNCHCGQFIYEIQTPEITSVGECNCSICSRKGYLWVFPGKDNFKVVKGDVEALSSYTFEPKNREHRFCGNCGTGLLARDLESMALGINVHAIQGLNTWTLEKRSFDGKALGAPFKPHPFKGSLPEVEVENGKIHTGSCHCGNLTIAVNVPAVDSTYPDTIIECNCSICERAGYIWIYPTNPQVSLHATSPSDLGLYHFGHGLLNKTFCKTCGVYMTNQYRPNTEEEIAAMGDFDKSWIPVAKKHHPVNVRVLDGVELGALPEREKSMGGERAPFYENP